MIQIEGVPGLAACVVKEGAVLWPGGFGYANFAANRGVALTSIPQ